MNIRNKTSLDKIKIASPCSADWDQMLGNEQVRFCKNCNINVYNISNMSKKQAEFLISNKEGRLCATFYRRTNGTILTQNYPARILNIKRLVIKVVGVAFTMLLSFNITSYGQITSKTNEQSLKTSIFTKNSPSSIAGRIYDETEAVINGAEIILINEANEKTISTTSDEYGKYKISILEPGLYTMKVEYPGFVRFAKTHIIVRRNKDLQIHALLRVPVVGEIIEDFEFTPKNKPRGRIINFITIPYRKIKELMVR
jgi:hypothetical protein